MFPCIMMIVIEAGLAVVLLLAALAAPGLGSGWFANVEQRLSRLAQRRGLALLIVGGVSIGLRILALPVLPIPDPTVDDEFGYLLQADTFLHGRLTNPTPPLWTHFETFHINMVPTYQAKYPPAQGMVLAAGRLIGGHPIAGVWLSMAAMCAAICWLLQEWISPEWGLVGGLLVAIRLSVFSSWGNSYWGGAVAAIGGALLVGALVRLMRRLDTRDALLMGLGIAILANSRPYEGLLVSLPVAITVLVWWLKKTGEDFWLTTRRAILPLTMCLVLTGLAMGYYNWRVTGHPLELPYQANEAAYSITPTFIFQTPRPQPTYRHDALREFYLSFELPQYEQTQTLRGLLGVWAKHLETAWLSVGPLLTLPLLFALVTVLLRRRGPDLDWSARFLLWTSLVSIAGFAVEVYWFAHYAAPALGVFLIILLLAMRSMRHWTFRGRASGLFLSRTVPLGCLLMLMFRAEAKPLRIDLWPTWPPTWYNSDAKYIPRSDLERKLERDPGRQLVLVTYHAYVGPERPPHEWIYNAADINSAKIVWAWDMGDAKNQELIDYFPDRQVWRVTVDAAQRK